MEDQNSLLKAPEVLVSGGANTSTASDVWNFGVLLYALVAGRLPFNTIDEVIQAPISWSTLSLNKNKVSENFKTLVNSMLKKQAH